MTKQGFIEAIAGYVTKYAISYGIVVHSPIIAQAILESGWGKSTLAATHHNYFGLKCGSKWTGKSVNLATKEEYEPGTLTDIRDDFRVYDSMEAGVIGYFEFIQLSRYHNLRGITDPKTYLETIKADGYATSSAYVQNVMNLVEQYKLTQYDRKGDTMSKTRSAVVGQAAAWIGRKESDGSHREIIDIYNSHNPRPRGYRLKYTDAWCAGFVSAVAIKLGYTDVIPPECSCGYMIQEMQKLGIWVENDAHIPSAGDIIMYDWQDTGSGDNVAWPDHVGIVESVSGGIITVIEGNYGNAVNRRKILVNDRYIRGYGVPKYDSAGSTGEEKAVEELAQEIIDGKWGNNPDRKAALTAAGYDYDAVQAKVNELLSPAASPSKSVEELAQEVIAGEWGNSPERKERLEAAGHDYAAVQARVNDLMQQ